MLQDIRSRGCLAVGDLAVAERENFEQRRSFRVLFAGMVQSFRERRALPAKFVGNLFRTVYNRFLEDADRIFPFERLRLLQDIRYRTHLLTAVSMQRNVIMVKNAMSADGKGPGASAPGPAVFASSVVYAYARIITSVILNGVSALSACVTFAGMMIPCPAESFRGSPPIAISTLPSVTRTSAS